MATIMKRIALIICILALTLTFAPKFVTNAQAAEPFEYGYSLLKTDYEKAAYKALSDGIRNCDKTIEFGIAPKNYQESLKSQYIQEIKDATFKALRMVMADHPEYFWFDGRGELSLCHDSWTTFKVQFIVTEYSVDDNKVTKANVDQYIREVEMAADKALKNMPTDSDLSKIHYLHDYLAEHMDYEFGDDDQTIYGALVEEEAVCAGYSRAYQYLLTKAGIQCWYVTGYSINPNTMNQVAHAWNLVYLNGKCYYTDVTWDDQNETFHAYYMLSLAEASQSHFPDHPEDLPASCGHTDLDYFEVHKGAGTGVGILKPGYTAADFAACMKKVDDKTWSCHVEDLSGGTAEEFLNWLNSNQVAVAAALGIRGGFGWSISTLWDEYQVDFHSTDTHVHTFPLLSVNAKTPDCTNPGNIQYYICASCNGWFLNPDGTGPINDKDSVKIPAESHTYNKWENDTEEHWKACKDCGVEEQGTRASHYDNNKDNKCDVCGARVESPTVPTIAPTVAPTTAPTDAPATRPTTTPTTTPTNPNTESTPSPTTESTVNPSEQPSSGVATEPSQDPSSEPTDEPVTQPSAEPTAPSTEVTVVPSRPTDGNEPTTETTTPATMDTEQKSDNDMLPIIIVGGVVAVGVVVTAILLILRKKK
ncbi:MAG: hypothetical protein J6A88_00675 [Oscillospiraceae bacterium]|nr:hypothetical protein [Oscillospiraceae bacterium]